MTNAEVLASIDGRSGNRDRLIRWMDGFGGLPGDDPEEQPYLRLLRCLPTDHRLPGYEDRVAESIVAILDAYPRLNPPDCDANRVAFNLLNLASHLRRRDQLADALRRLLAPDALARRRCSGMDLRHALRRALTVHQKGTDLSDLWFAMFAGETEGALGTPHDAIRGIVYMQNPLRPGYPAREAIGRGIGRYVSAIDRALDRVDKLAGVFKLAEQRFQGQFDGREWIDLYDKHRWPDWVETAIPKLYFEKSERDFTLWLPAYEYVNYANAVEKKTELCGGRVFDAVVEGAAQIWLKAIANIFEEYRYLCDRVEFAIRTALSALEENQWTGAPPEVVAFVKARLAASPA